MLVSCDGFFIFSLVGLPMEWVTHVASPCFLFDSVWPHGRRSIYIMCLSLSTFFMSLCATWGCYFIQVDHSFTSTGEEGLTKLQEGKAGWGLFTYEDGRKNEDDHDWKCYRYSSEQEDLLDDAITTAQVYGIVANALLGVAALLFLISACCAFPRMIVLACAFVEFAGGVMIALTLTTLSTEYCSGEYSCRFYAGAAFAILTAIVAVINSIVMVTLQPAKYLFDTNVQDGELLAFSPGTETVTETVMLDGTTKIAKITTHDDGAQTIEETVIEPDEEKF